MKCKNCDLTLSIESEYCSSCGSKVIKNRLTIKNLLEHFTETFLNYDNKFLQTFIRLFTKPEAVINGYIDGIRKKYVDVISYFAIAITISGLQLFILNKFFPEAVDFTSVTQKGNEQMSKNVYDFIKEYQSIAMMINVPIYALISKIVFIKENKFKYNYTEHLVIFMYILAQTSIINSILIGIGGAVGFSIGTLSMIFGPLQLIYSGYCLKRVFDLDLKNLAIRTFIFIVVLAILSILFIAIFILVVKNNGGLEAFIEAQKKGN